MVHGILQFTPSIAFRYVLHRCESRDIRCRESFWIFVERRRRIPLALRVRGGGSALPRLIFLGAARAGVRCFAEAGETLLAPRGGRGLAPGARPRVRVYGFAGRSAGQVSTMILPQVHLRKPCYDFSFL